MSVRVLANEQGEILYSQGDTHQAYGIASLSKIWASVLIHEQMRGSTLDIALNKPFTVTVDYPPMIYSRTEPRLDLQPPDDPLTYQPFRPEKSKFCLPVEKGKSYTPHELFEATLFHSRNDAAQALADHFFANDDNRSFRKASNAMANRLGLKQTKVGDPHGLCDGDNVSSGKDLMEFCATLYREGHMELFSKFDPTGKEHTARPLLDDRRLASSGIKILLAKTGTGSNRHGNDMAESLLIIAKRHDQIRFAVTLTDEDKFNTIYDMLAKI